jgi:hypothetical protein
LRRGAIRRSRRIAKLPDSGGSHALCPSGTVASRCRRLDDRRRNEQETDSRQKQLLHCSLHDFVRG